jgi:hypothetical protein
VISKTGGRDLREAGEQGQRASSDGSTLRLRQRRLNLCSSFHLSVTDASWLHSSRRPLASSAEEQRRRWRWRRSGRNRRRREQPEADGDVMQASRGAHGCPVKTTTPCRWPGAPVRVRPAYKRRAPLAQCMHVHVRACRRKSRLQGPCSYVLMHVCVHAVHGGRDQPRHPKPKDRAAGAGHEQMAAWR